MAAATVNWVYFLETWLKFSNNLTQLKVSYDETTGLYFMSGCIEIGCEVGELNWCHDVDKPTKRQTLRTLLQSFIFLILFLCFRVLQFLYIHGKGSLYSFSCALYTNFQGSSFECFFFCEFFQTWCWFCVDVSVLHCRRMNGPWIWLESYHAWLL